MKPFDLEAAKAGAKVITRQGQSVRILCFDLVGDYPIVAAVFDEEDNEEFLITQTNMGNTCIGNSIEQDLFMAPAKTGAWVNVYPDYVASMKFPTQIMADESAGNTRIACVYVEWEE